VEGELHRRGDPLRKGEKKETGDSARRKTYGEHKANLAIRTGRKPQSLRVSPKRGGHLYLPGSR